MFVIEMVTGRWAGLLVGGEFDPLARVSEGMLRDIRIAVVHCLVIGYLPAALLYAMRSGPLPCRLTPVSPCICYYRL